MKFDIYRILRHHFGFGVNQESLETFDLFMERFGKAISLDIMSILYQSMYDSLKEEDKVQQFRLEINLEKSKQFECGKGEYIK